jgi:hypothetical protein
LGHLTSLNLSDNESNFEGILLCILLNLRWKFRNPIFSLNKYTNLYPTYENTKSQPAIAKTKERIPKKVL